MALKGHIFVHRAVGKTNYHQGSGCGAVGRAVASDTRGPRFESSHRRNFIHVFTINCIEKTKIKKKEAGNGPFFLKKNYHLIKYYFSIHT